MAYFVEISAGGPAASFLADQENVSSAMRRVLEESLELHLGEKGDHFCLTEHFRIPGTSRITFEIILRDPETHKYRKFRVIASDEFAPQGVLRVLYLDEPQRSDD